MEWGLPGSGKPVENWGDFKCTNMQREAKQVSGELMPA